MELFLRNQLAQTHKGKIVSSFDRVHNDIFSYEIIKSTTVKRLSFCIFMQFILKHLENRCS